MGDPHSNPRRYTELTCWRYGGWGNISDLNSGKYFTNAFIKANQTWIDQNKKIDVNILLAKTVGGQDPLQGTNHTSTDTEEQWADTFANYVAGNIDMSKSAGMDMYKFTRDIFVPDPRIR